MYKKYKGKMYCPKCGKALKEKRTPEFSMVTGKIESYLVKLSCPSFWHGWMVVYYRIQEARVSKPKSKKS